MIQDQPAVSASRRIASLDGWRGVAILLVLFDHFQSSLNHGYLRPWTQTGIQGVTIFFVLSGFLITSKLLEGPINLRRFYIRRFFRLMPVAWAYLGCLWLFDLGFKHVLSLREAASCLFFYRNYLGDTGSAVAAHFWSLSMEEQFYLIWPSLLLLAGVRRTRLFALFGAVACAVYTYLHWDHYDRIWISFRTEAHADAILIGCLVALLLADRRIRNILARWSSLYTFPALATLLICIPLFHWLPPIYENAAIGMLMAESVLHPQNYLARLMSSPVLTRLGIVSYSIYVWQQFFMLLPGTAGFFILSIGLPLFVTGSYLVIERPCIRLGYRLTGHVHNAEDISAPISNAWRETTLETQ